MTWSFSWSKSTLSQLLVVSVCSNVIFTAIFLFGVALFSGFTELTYIPNSFLSSLGNGTKSALDSTLISPLSSEPRSSTSPIAVSSIISPVTSSSSQTKYPDKFTLLVLTYGTYKPDRNLTWIIKQYVHWGEDFLAEVLIVWNFPHNQSEILEKDLKDLAVPFRIRYETKNSMNNRWKSDLEIKTDAVMFADDDSFFRNPSIIPLYFRMWKRHPERMLGSTASYIKYDEEGLPWYMPRKIFWPCPKVPFNFLLPIGLMIHRKYMEAYWKPEYQFVRDLVDETRNCEDLGMNFVVTKELANQGLINDTWGTNMCLPTPWDFIEMKRQGTPISWHAKTRTPCVRKLQDFFGMIPTGTHRDEFCKFAGRETCWKHFDNDPDLHWEQY